MDASNAASNIVDFDVDQVLKSKQLTVQIAANQNDCFFFFKALGPNVRANLLKNLHNKSLAEASIAHLAKLPRPKNSKDVVARRKHQITYLATVVRN